MMDDEFDALLRDAAETYNTPPEPPREMMWEAISRGREQAGVPISTRRTPRWLATGAAAAAVLLLGIAIGRFTGGAPASSGSIATATQPVPAPSDTMRTPAPSLATTDAPDANAPERVATAPNRASASDTRRAAASMVAAQRGARIERDNAASDRASDAMSYRFAVVEHLTRAEVLLTGFRAQARPAEGAKLDAQFASVARELLGTTRMMLTTRGAEDPALTRLLEDLELVLMQLSQYARDGRRVDLDAINQSLDKRNVLPKLRSTIPAGVSASAGT